MKVKRIDLDSNTIEYLPVIGKVRYLGNDDQADLTRNKSYYIVGIVNNLLKIIDDTGDYYLYLPVPGEELKASKEDCFGFVIEADPTGEIGKAFGIAAKKIAKENRRLVPRIIRRIMANRK